MRFWRSSVLLAALCTAAAAQTPVATESPAVERVAKHLKCTCGCNLDMNCKMEPWPCHMCRPAKEKIVAMQKAGMDDASILNAFVKEQGPDILIVEPGIWGSLSHYAGLAAGLLLIAWFIRRKLAKPAPVSTPASEADDAILARYKERMEKEVAKLD